MAIAQPVSRYTPAEYYRLEEQEEYKSEYYDGEIFAMAGASESHILICASLMRDLGIQLKGKDCAPYGSDARLKVVATGLCTYPDASVYCGRLERDPDDVTGHTFTNPTVLFEVLSPSTEMYDRRVKSAQYRKIASLRALALVSQDCPRVDVFFRQPDDTWALLKLEGIGQVLRLPIIGVDLPLADIYDRVAFDGTAGGPQTPAKM